MAERAAKQLELNKSELPNSITEVIATLSRAGFDAYIVGGGVRDPLLGLEKLSPSNFFVVCLYMFYKGWKVYKNGAQKFTFH